MYEVEVKVRADHDAVRERLEAIGAERRGVVTQIDTYYDAPERDFAETDEALRIRREGADEDESVARITYKGPLVDEDSKTRAEAEAVVADGDATAAVLEGLGYEPAATVRKRRERYEYAGFAVVLDDVEDLGEFVEVETDAEVDVAAARDRAFEVLETLGLDPSEQIRTSYLGLLLESAAENASNNASTDAPDTTSTNTSDNASE